jgi:histidinol phosphatase-like enzyme (inositol monophosphatase family)
MSIDATDFDEYLQFANELADAAAAAILPHFRAGGGAENKSAHGFDPVTAADRGAERAMRALLKARYPHHAVLGEEEGGQAGTGLTWVLAPIDGTKAFLLGLPLWGTLIALNDGTRPVLGLMNQPFTRERFVGTAHCAWNGGHVLHTRPCAQLADAHVMCTSPDIFDPAQRTAFDGAAARARLLRYGGDCYAYCMLAAGHVDAVIEAGLKPWDVQALVPIIEGAGGVITTWDGGDVQHGGTVLACGDARLHAQLVTALGGS